MHFKTTRAKELLRSMRTIKRGSIGNPHNVCERFGGEIFIDYQNQSLDRASRCSAYFVYSPFFKTDPDGHWMNNGAKEFAVHHYQLNGVSLKEARALALKAAQDWAAEKYGIKEWGRDPFGGWQAIEVIKKMKAAMKEAERASEA